MPRSDLLGLPCVGCGYCCILCLCSYAEEKYGSVERCPELYWTGSRYRCYQLPHNKQVADGVSFGAGCYVPTSWRLDVRQRERKEIYNIRFCDEIIDQLRIHAAQFK